MRSSSWALAWEKNARKIVFTVVFSLFMKNFLVRNEEAQSEINFWSKLYFKCLLRTYNEETKFSVILSFVLAHSSDSISRMFIINSRDCHMTNNSNLMTHSKGKPPNNFLSHMLILRKTKGFLRI